MANTPRLTWALGVDNQIKRACEGLTTYRSYLRKRGVIHMYMSRNPETGNIACIVRYVPDRGLWSEYRGEHDYYILQRIIRSEFDNIDRQYG